MLNFALFTTRPGWMGIIASTEGIRKIILPQISRDNVLRQISTEYDLNNIGNSSSSFGDLVQRLQLYMDGSLIDFPDKLDLSRATTFQNAVWEITRTIPYGETESYSWIANRLGIAGARAVGQALKRNPVPILIPCHRVIRNDESLGGFRGGIEFKRYLLEMESSS